MSTPRTRTTSATARGEPYVWLTGTALAVCLVMIVGLLAIAAVQGMATFWPRPIDTVTTRSGEVFLGIPMREEAFDPNADVAEALSAIDLRPRDTDSQGRPKRRLYRVANRGVHDDAFRWVPLHEIERTDRDRDVAMVERHEWGVWLGTPSEVRVDGAAVDDEDAWSALRNALPDAHARRAEIERLRKHEIGAVQNELEAVRLRQAQKAIDHRRTSDHAGASPSLARWGAILVVSIIAAAGALRILTRERTPGAGAAQVGAGTLCLLIALGGLLVSLLESPWSRTSVSDEALARSQTTLEARAEALNDEYNGIFDRIGQLEAVDETHRVLIVEPSAGRFAPERVTEPDEPMRTSQIVRAIRSNDLSLAGKIGVYFDRWGEFLAGQPREANTEGGVFPVIFGTVLLTLLLTVTVMPLGVIAALYIHEYARRGLVISLVRIAVNNLAGVPSIVYGVFGLGFFCYTVGKFVDAGPTTPAPKPGWWLGVGLTGLVIFGAILAGLTAGKPRARTSRVWGTAVFVLWLLAAIGAATLLWTTPYFNGFFEARLPSQTFGTRGILWAALTLALLTLPVVIVATEEALASVPGSMREGSYACGATKWQTIQRIVLPRAMPGIMTGMILAMARGAGEVAPLMLVGAVKHASELPISSSFPYLHLERNFMHLGFHIYDVGFKSPDADAARPLVWTTTCLLIAIVLALNIAAIRLRARLRRRFVGNAF